LEILDGIVDADKAMNVAVALINNSVNGSDLAPLAALGCPDDKIHQSEPYVKIIKLCYLSLKRPFDTARHLPLTTYFSIGPGDYGKFGPCSDRHPRKERLKTAPDINLTEGRRQSILSRP
jgi:hypothetical protein